MNGGLDLTLVPMSFIDEVAVQYGGAGSLFGSGTLGGAIHLSSGNLEAATGWNSTVHQQLGSFGSRYLGISGGYRQEKLRATVRVFTHRADHDFPFYNRYTNRKERRQNAGIQQRGLLTQTQWTPSPRHTVKATYWHQDNAVQVADVAAASGASRATQHDVFHRAVVHWQRRGAQQQWQVRTALLHHHLVYDDKVRAPSVSRSTSWITEAENTYYLSDENWLHGGVNHTYETAEVDGYAQPVRRNRTALFLSYRTQWQSALEATVGARETLIAGNWSPFLPSLGLRYALSPCWQLRSKVARSYQVPTFNDLYWAGSGGRGNAALQPETGWSTEVGAVFKQLPTSPNQATASLSLFSNHIDQWISWVPVEGAIWTPINVEQVWARGLEWEGSVRYPVAPSVFLKGWGQYSFTKSTKEQIKAGGSATELHKQLRYTPYHLAKASLSMHYHRLTIDYTAVWVGEQYTTSSNRRVLPAYQTGDLAVAYRWPLLPKHQVQLRARVDNLWNAAYDVREGYPMPGRHYQCSLMYQFNQLP